VEVNGAPSVSFSKFLDDYSQNLLWFSYRKGFPPIDNTLLTTDGGWGCMLRSGQMMLAQALIRHRLGRDWTLNKGGPVPPEIFQIVRLFGDNPTPDHPYCLHNIATTGQKYGKTIGEWFSPSVVALSLAELVTHYKSDHIRLLVSEDATLYRERVLETCAPPAAATGAADIWTTGAVFVVPLRLGLDAMNAIYYPPLLELFQFPQSLGIVGGKPRASMFFVAAQDEYVFYLDPHVIQNFVNTDEDFPIDTFRTTCTRKMHVSEIDPSLALAFHCRDQHDFDDFCHRMDELAEKHKDAILFTISQTVPDYKSSSHREGEGEGEGQGEGEGEGEGDAEIDMDMVVM